MTHSYALKSSVFVIAKSEIPLLISSLTTPSSINSRQDAERRWLMTHSYALKSSAFVIAKSEITLLISSLTTPSSINFKTLKGDGDTVRLSRDESALDQFITTRPHIVAQVQYKTAVAIFQNLQDLLS